ncbi:MSMEG_0570 family nitrogen starvation response protein [Actinokineospora sp. G85]|uniref:MSMEG_0570 family nitrogen starvation response protein n=1 Tax=Actinokineospora sp. G85 TaxID=3406626 RepID=UPI003C752761
MPEMFFTVRWPDGTAQRCYSPSLVVEDHLEPGARYPVAEFVQRSCAALEAGSERVRARYGFACSNAQAQMGEIRARAAALDGSHRAGHVRVEGFER